MKILMRLFDGGLFPNKKGDKGGYFPMTHEVSSRIFPIDLGNNWIDGKGKILPIFSLSLSPFIKIIKERLWWVI